MKALFANMHWRVLFSYPHFGLSSAGFDPEYNFFRSRFLPPMALACIRALISLYCFTTMVVCYSYLAKHISTNTLHDVNIDSYTLYVDKHGIQQSFSFFTYLTYWSLGFYFAISSFHTFCYAIKGQTWLHKWPKPLQLLHSFYYTTVTVFPFLVTIVFWGTMYSGPWPKGRFEQWINISVHGFNSVFALVEIILTAADVFPWSHLPVLLGVLSLYLGLAYLTRYTQGFYVYEWMNPAHGTASIILHILGYTAGICTIFVLVRGAIWLRNKISDRRETERKIEMMKLDDQSDIV